MNAASVLRTVILVLAAGAMAVGVAVMAGWLVPSNLPDRFRIPIGAVVFLYGAYRFIVAWFRTAGERGHETL